jgi:hypothetical protein
MGLSTHVVSEVLLGLDQRFRTETSADYALKDQNRVWFGLVVEMFSCMKGISEVSIVFSLLNLI